MKYYEHFEECIHVGSLRPRNDFERLDFCWFRVFLVEGFVA